MMHAKLQAAVQLDTGLYVVEREALCATFLGVSMHSGNGCPRHAHPLYEVRVLCVCVKGA